MAIMASLYDYNSTSSTGKRKHYDEEAQAMADEFDDWKKQRTANDSTINTTDPVADMMQQDGAICSELTPPSGDSSSVRTERSTLSYMESSGSDGVMEVEEETTTVSPGPQNPPSSDTTNNSWAMINLKQWRRVQEAPQKLVHARKEMKRLWRNSSSDLDQEP